MTIPIHATLLSFYREFPHLVGRPVSPAWLAAASALAELPCGGTGTAVFADGQERTIRRDARGFVWIDGPETRHAED
jgi:hypothetical protein